MCVSHGSRTPAAGICGHWCYSTGGCPKNTLNECPRWGIQGMQLLVCRYTVHTHSCSIVCHLRVNFTHTHTHLPLPPPLSSWAQRLFYIVCTTQLHLVHWRSSRCVPCMYRTARLLRQPTTHTHTAYTLNTPYHPPLAGLPACLHPPGTAHYSDLHSSRTVEITFPLHIAIAE